MNFCRRCGKPLEQVKGHVYKCEDGHVIYGNSTPCTAIFVVRQDGKVWLSIRGIEPHKGALDSFGGFNDGPETFEDTANRELQEETGLTLDDYEPLQYFCSTTDNYPYKGEEIPYVCTYWLARLKTDKPLVPSSDVAEIKLYDVDEVDIRLLHDGATREGFLKLRDIINQERGKS